MADPSPAIETMENRWMRAWVAGDSRELKALIARDFSLLVASKPAMILDRRSWLEAAGKRWVCKSFRFRDLYARRIGALAVFSSQIELTSTLDGKDWSGAIWVTDLWRKRRIGGWKMVHRALSRVEDDGEVPAAIGKLQLWR